MATQNHYSDPYNNQQHHQDYPLPRNDSNYSNAYSDDNTPYGEVPRYPAYPADPSAGGYQSYPSGEKLNEADYEEPNTARAQPGRSGLRPQKSWADIGPPPRSTGILREWRKGERGKQWFRGGGCRSFMRLCCCCGSITIVMIVSIILSILLWVVPPSLSLNDVTVGSSPVSVTSTGLTVTFALNISVSNPNWFNADFTEITAKARYPGNNTNTFGGGTLYNLDFVGNTRSTFEFPFTLNYTTALDPNKVILNDLISKCGISGGTVSDITVDYDLLLKLKVLGVTVSPTFSSSASFECPITKAQIAQITGSGL